MRTLFGAETVHLPMVDDSGSLPGTQPAEKVPKPSGEVTRLSREGYNLREAL